MLKQWKIEEKSKMGIKNAPNRKETREFEGFNCWHFFFHNQIQKMKLTQDTITETSQGILGDCRKKNV